MKLSLFSATATALSAVLLLAFVVDEADSHGYMSNPLSRNYYAHVLGLTWGTQPGVPNKEYCFHCLNTKGPGSVCGTSEGGINYDDWVDSLLQPMPWNSNGNVYAEGSIITVESFLTAHHAGHAELRACPNGRDSTQDCFDENVLEFVQDATHGMPKDENYPERGYYYGPQGFNDNGYTMKFRLPQGLVGQNVLLQWTYITANSCSPEGYDDYYGLHQQFAEFNAFDPNLPKCTPEDFPPAYFTGDSPERFVNCAEITVLSSTGDVDNENQNDPVTSSPVAVVTSSPVAAPVQTPTESNNGPNNDVNNNVNNVGTCGGGNRGNGICPDQSMCCSQWGWCGTVATGHCDDYSSPVTSPVESPVDNESPVEAPTVPAPIVITPTNNDHNHDGDASSRLIAYLGNWQACPTDEQVAQYTHIVIAFAVSYTWSPGKNICSETCEIATPPVCNNSPQPALLQKWKNDGKKIILSFGGAGMGGSWAGDANDCWDYCFGREAQVVSRLTEIVDEMGLDGVDIDYEYFYENNQSGSGFSKGAEAQKFLKEVTVGLRNANPVGFELTHAPMEPDMEPGSAYFELLKEISGTLDFLMPQYYNGYVYAYSNFPSALNHYNTLTNILFGGDASKIVFGFCIGDCGNFNLDGYQASEVMEKLTEEYPCNGGAFFWVVNDDTNGQWSKPLKEQLIANSMVCSDGDDLNPVSTPVANPTNPPVGNPTSPPVVAPTDPPISLDDNLFDPPTGDGGKGCCSQDYKTCATWCNSGGREECETNPVCDGMKWLENGPVLGDSALCLARWADCTNAESTGCCEGLQCVGNVYYKQCLPIS